MSPRTGNRWEQLRDMPPVEEAARQQEVVTEDDPLGAVAVCSGCWDDWPCDFERGRRSLAASQQRYRWTPTGMVPTWDGFGLDSPRWIEVIR